MLSIRVFLFLVSLLFGIVGRRYLRNHPLQPLALVVASQVSLFGAHNVSRSNAIELTQELEAQVGQLGGGHGGHGERSRRQIWTRSRWEGSR
jgi:hypothetical protein